MDRQFSDKIKSFAGAVEKFVENNLMEKHQREENIKKVTDTLDLIMKESLKQGIKVAQQYRAKAEEAVKPAESDSHMTLSDYKIQTVPVQVKKLENFKGELPKYQTSLASGLDVRAQLDQPIEVGVGQRVLVPTGLSFAIPAGYEIQARPRSGWAIKDGMSLLNTPGTIDADYRGEVKIILVNLGDKTVTINDQERIAQLVLCPVVQAVFQEVTELDSTARGAGGFGSTGR